MKNIAVYGGTFDPPTLAHEAILDACLARPDMDEVWLMPSGVRTDKPGMADVAGRLALLEAVVAERTAPKLRIIDFELQLPQPTQTYNTVQALETAYPDNRFWFVYGADSYHDMPNWERGIELQRRLGMLLIGRAGYGLPVEAETIRHLHVETTFDMSVSSTKVRQALVEGLDIGQMVSPIVAAQLRGALK